MRQCSKSVFLTLLIFSLCVVLILLHFQKEPEDQFLRIIWEDDLHQEKLKTAQNTSRLFNLSLRYKIKSSCKSNTDLLAVIIVTSYFGNVETRGSMRRAFSNEELEKYGIRRVFLLGLAPHDNYTTQKAILNEQKRFGDIIQGNFVEAYKNLTYKHLMGLKWAAKECSLAKYIIKMDDDIVINLRGVVQYLTGIKLPNKLLAGYILQKMPAIREPYNKWYVKPEEFREKYYPNFLSGWFYITNPSTAAQLVAYANDFPYFWIDDAFITGIIARKLKIKHFDIGKNFVTDPQHYLCCYRDIEDHNINCDYLIGPNGGDNNLFYKMNEALKNCFFSKCVRRTKPLNETCKIDFDQLHVNRGNPIIEDFRLF